MNASTPPPPQGSSTGLYAGIAVLLLAGIGGLIAWKSCNKPDVAPPVNTLTPHPSAAPSSTLKIDDIPLPPPEDAGLDAGPTQPTKSTGTTFNSCDVKTCNGSASDDLAAALQHRAKQVTHRCYDNALLTDNTLQGRVFVKVKIAANGTICSAAVDHDETGNASLASCAAAALGHAGQLVVSPKGGCVDINLPINFKPGGR